MPQGHLSRYNYDKHHKGTYTRILLSKEHYTKLKAAAGTEMTTIAHVAEKLIEQYINRI